MKTLKSIRFGIAPTAVVLIIAFVVANIVDTIQASTDEKLYEQPEAFHSAYKSDQWLISDDNINREFADDFVSYGIITRVTVNGFGMGAAPDYRGFYVRIYEFTADNRTPGKLQAEHFIAAGSPQIVNSRLQQIDIILPTPFQATGRHFLSIQAMTDSPWYWLKADGDALHGEAFFTRQNNDSSLSAWQRGDGEPFSAPESDMSFALHGLDFPGG